MGRRAKELYQDPVSEYFFGRRYSNGKRRMFSLNTKNEEDALERLPIVLLNNLSWNNCIKNNVVLDKRLIEKTLRSTKNLSRDPVSGYFFGRWYDSSNKRRMLSLDSKDEDEALERLPYVILNNLSWRNCVKTHAVFVSHERARTKLTRQEIIKALRTTHVEEFSSLWKNKEIILWPFERSRDHTHNLGLKNRNEWKLYRKSGNKPSGIPYDPQVHYKGKGWISWSDWLGKNFVMCKNPRSFEEARQFARSKKFKSQRNWRDFCKSSLRPLDIPATPDRVYKPYGWIGWDDWLGKE